MHAMSTARESTSEDAAHARTTGRVLAVCLGPGGIPKHEVEVARVDEDGLAGDRHRFRYHGGKNRAVCLFSTDDYASLRADGVAAEEPGTFGENVLLDGLDFAAMRPGDRVELGGEVVLEIHDVRAPCNTLRSVDRRFPNLMLGRSGYLCRVVRGGELRAGMDARWRASGSETARRGEPGASAAEPGACASTEGRENAPSRGSSKG